MSTSSYENVNKLLEYYDECQNHVDGYKGTINMFLTTLQSNYNSEQATEIKMHKFYRVGSSYEETVVYPEADFDIGMVLSPPYSMDFFSAKKTGKPGLFKLKRVPGSSANPRYFNTSKFLKVEDLKDKVCKDLISVLESMGTTQGFTIHAKEIYSGVTVELKKLNHDTLNLDIIPQIEGNPEKDLPDWNGENMGEFMKDVIKKKHLGVYFTLSAPPSSKKKKKKRKRKNKQKKAEKNGFGGGGGGFGGYGSSRNHNDNQAKLSVQTNFTIIEKEILGEVSVNPEKDVYFTVNPEKDVYFTGNREKDLPDRNGENMPEFMKDFIKKKHLGVYLTPSAPPSLKKQRKKKKKENDNQAKLIVQANFTIIEKEILLEVSDTVVDAVRISKGLLHCNPFLKTGGLRSYQIKRVALQHLEEIEATEDSWDGYQLLMDKYIQMLKSGGVKGYLIKEQECLWKNEEKCAELGRRLERLFQEIGPENALKHLAVL